MLDHFLNDRLFGGHWEYFECGGYKWIAAKTEPNIKPPRSVAGMEKALPDYSERLARRTGLSEACVEAQLQPKDAEDVRV